MASFFDFVMLLIGGCRVFFCRVVVVSFVGSFDRSLVGDYKVCAVVLLITNYNVAVGSL